MCAPYLATDRVRVSRDGGRNYPRSSERPLTDRLPDAPAAVRIYDRDSTTRVLVADFDVAKDSPAQVTEDAEAFTDLVHQLGGLTITDRSPTGGRHVYVPLAEPVPWLIARRVAHGLARRYPTLDPLPMLNQDGGCIRPPGARHKTGGWQELLTGRDDTIRALTKRTSAQVFTELALLVGVDPDAPANYTDTSDWEQATAIPPLKPRRRALSAEWQVMATTGERPTSWPSDSEARLAFLRAAARHGWTFLDVTNALESGQWPAITALYARYRPGQRRRALVRDWRKAATTAPLNTTARNIDTREPLTQGHPLADGGYLQIREWWTVLAAVEKRRWPGRAGLSLRRVLRALGAAAQRSGSAVISHGVRSLAEGAGLDHATVAAALKTLREEDEPFIRRLTLAHGLAADTYELVIPESMDHMRNLRWRAGIIRSVHPIFRVLGGAAFLVWETLASAGASPVSAFDISTQTGIPVRTVQETLLEFGELGVCERGPDGWVIVGRLEEASDLCGARELHTQVVASHRRDRAGWRGRILRVVGDTGLDTDYHPPPQSPEGDDSMHSDALTLLTTYLPAATA